MAATEAKPLIKITNRGDFRLTRDFINRARNREIYSELDSFGRMGVNALSRMTPVRTSLAANSWGYRILRTSRKTSIEWYNTDLESGVSVVILLQYGHATGTGGYVAGRDFINPAMRPVFDQIAENVWRKVVK